MKDKTLPDGWKEVTLADIGEVVTGNTPPKINSKNYGKDIVWIKPPDLNKEKYVNNSEDRISNYAKDKVRRVPKGSVLVSCIGIIGKVAIANCELCTNQQINSIIPKNDVIDSEFLYYTIKKIKPFLEKQGSSAVVPLLNKSEFSKIKILLPPLSTQQKIISILEKAEETKQMRSESDELTNKFLQAVFLEMFGDPTTNPKGWTIKNMDELCERITDGEHITPKRTTKGIYLLSARNIQNHKIALDDVDFIGDEEYHRISKRIVPQNGDILISCSGTIGRVTRVKEKFKFQLVRSVALIRPKNGIVHPTYLEYGYDTNFMKNQIERVVNQSSQANLFQGKIRKLSIPLPPLPLQQKFASIVEKVEAMCTLQKSSKQEIENLFNALMQKAFNGELVA